MHRVIAAAATAAACLAAGSAAAQTQLERVDKDGHPLKPPMGYAYYSKISADDMAALIVWLRSLPPKKTP
jgi:hypothetical protein